MLVGRLVIAEVLVHRREAPQGLCRVRLRARLDEAEKCFRAADSAFEQMESVGHRTGAWVALGDLAERRGDVREAARWYRNAAEALAVVRF
jgi:uncharacterized protein HemY